MVRPEYPRPNLVRNTWMNLNGQWAFEFDDNNIGLIEKWQSTPQNLSRQITVPFAFQTKLSGITDTRFHDYIWYSREFSLPTEMLDKNIILHFGAVDYHTKVFVNGQLATEHIGGHTSFSVDITTYLTADKKAPQNITLWVHDPSTDETIPRGKQFWQEKSDAIWYTRTSGIWQTVWLEGLNKSHIEKLHFTPDIDKGDVTVDFEVTDFNPSMSAEITISFKGEIIAQTALTTKYAYNKVSLNLYNRHIFRTEYHHNGWNWSPETPNLFDVEIKLKNSEGAELDSLTSYFGMRKIHTQNGMVYLNNKPYYQKLVLDQGYWQEGLLTAPSDEDLKKDIVLAKELGFNGCRKHQKVEDPRFLYHADTLGFLVWGECAAPTTYTNDAVSRLTNEWIEIIERDYNHPCIVTWVPINESWGVPHILNNKQQQNHSLAMYHLIHSLDPTRLVISNDGWEMTRTDICAIHNYNHGNKDEVEKYEYYKETLATKEGLLTAEPAGRVIYAGAHKHMGEPILLTEFGGVGYKAGSDAGWGYTSVASEQDFVADYRRIMEAVFASKALFGFCYTQLTDVEQEINGLLTYDRKPKCDMNEIKKLNNLWHVPTIDLE